MQTVMQVWHYLKVRHCAVTLTDCPDDVSKEAFMITMAIRRHWYHWWVCRSLLLRVCDEIEIDHWCALAIVVSGRTVALHIGDVVCRTTSNSGQQSIIFNFCTSSTTGKCGCNFKLPNFNVLSFIDIFRISREIATVSESYPRQSWPTSMSSYGVTRPTIS